MATRASAIRTLCWAALGACLSLSSARAQDNFYAGKVIRIIVSGGGTYEGYARLFARHMPAHLPGKPAIIVQQMPGAGGARAASYLYNVASRDGLVIGAVHGSVLTAPLLTPGVDFDVTKFNWIGNATSDVFIGFVTAASRVQSLDQLKTDELVVGGAGVGSTGIDMALIGRSLFGLKLKIISGYKTSDETKLAMERGEVQGTFGTTLGSLKATDMLQRRAATIIVQHGVTPHREMPNVPLIYDLAKTDVERQILDVMRLRGEFAKPYLTPPNVPPDRLALLRAAFMATTADPGFLADVERQHLEFDTPMSGPEMTAQIEQISKTPRQVIDRLVEILGSFNDGKM